VRGLALRPVMRHVRCFLHDRCVLQKSGHGSNFVPQTCGVGTSSGVLPVPAVRGHHDGGTDVHPGPAKPDSVYNGSIIENPLSLALCDTDSQCT
jgi:hypothetical protein